MWLLLKKNQTKKEEFSLALIQSILEIIGVFFPKNIHGLLPVKMKGRKKKNHHLCYSKYILTCVDF